MDAVQDFEDFLDLLDRHAVRHLIIGGLAFIYHAKPRFTNHVDIWLDPVRESLARANLALAEAATVAGIPANQPTVGRYLHYLADALLIREFRRYPLAKKASARVPSKFTVSDLGVRNAVFRGAPSLWESDPAVLGPLVETLVQAVIRDHNLHVHFYRDYDNPDDRRSRVHEVDFVAERLDGRVLPVEVKFRRKIDPPDADGVRHFRARFDAPHAVVVTRETSGWERDQQVLYLPLQNFLLAF